MEKVVWSDKNNKTISVLPDGSVGFIYEIEYKSGKKYLGKKKAISVLNKKGKINGEKRKGHIRFFNRIVKRKRTRYEEVVSESKWREYEGSSELIDSKDSIVKKTILMVLDNESAMTYYESKLLFSTGAIESEEYYNESILGRFYKKATKGIMK